VAQLEAEKREWQAQLVELKAHSNQQVEQALLHSEQRHESTYKRFQEELSREIRTEVATKHDEHGLMLRQIMSLLQPSPTAAINLQPTLTDRTTNSTPASTMNDETIDMELDRLLNLKRQHALLSKPEPQKQKPKPPSNLRPVKPNDISSDTVASLKPTDSNERPRSRGRKTPGYLLNNYAKQSDLTKSPHHHRPRDSAEATPGPKQP
jgi:hypothetical protein